MTSGWPWSWGGQLEAPLHSPVIGMYVLLIICKWEPFQEHGLERVMRCWDHLYLVKSWYKLGFCGGRCGHLLILCLPEANLINTLFFQITTYQSGVVCHFLQLLSLSSGYRKQSMNQETERTFHVDGPSWSKALRWESAMWPCWCSETSHGVHTDSGRREEENLGGGRERDESDLWCWPGEFLWNGQPQKFFQGKRWYGHVSVEKQSTHGLLAGALWGTETM